MKNKIKFSILICTYNAAKHIASAIQSILDQSYNHYEILIWDNNSQDNTRNILTQFSKTDCRIKTFFHPTGIGWPHGISELLKHSTGDYMMFLGADDLFYDYCILENVAFEIEKTNSDIVLIGTKYALYDNVTKQRTIIEDYPLTYRLLNYPNKLLNLYYAMQQSYYNSMFHFENINFLKKWNIDFFDPFYCDCAGMTEALCRATTISMLEGSPHVLTANTSQTSGYVMMEMPMLKQWESVKQLLYREGFYHSDILSFITHRILTNLYVSIINICNEFPLRDADFQLINVTTQERLSMLSDLLKNKLFLEMDSLCYIKPDDDIYKQFLSTLKNYCKNNHVNLSVLYNNDLISRKKYSLNFLLEIAHNMFVISPTSNYLYVLEDCMNLLDDLQNDLSKNEFIQISQKLKEFI